MYYKVVHLSAGFMLTAILGTIISSMYIYPRSAAFGFTFSLFFILLFIAALISMTLAPVDAHFDIKHERKKSR